MNFAIVENSNKDFVEMWIDKNLNKIQYTYLYEFNHWMSFSPQGTVVARVLCVCFGFDIFKMGAPHMEAKVPATQGIE